MSAPQPVDILRYYKSSIEALNALKQSLQSALATGNVSPSSQFVAMTAGEVGDALQTLHRELEIEVIMMLAASFEALIQRDMEDRVSRKKKDDLSKAYRKTLRKPRPGRPGERRVTMEDLLDHWKNLLGTYGHVIGRMKSLFLFRHWVAHGRYWTEKSGLGEIEPFDAWQIGAEFFAVLPGFTPLPAW